MGTFPPGPCAPIRSPSLRTLLGRSAGVTTRHVRARCSPLTQVSFNSIPSITLTINRPKETMQWSHPDTVGDIPPPCRAHSATQVDRRIFVFGGGEGPMYFNHLYVLDTTTRRWTKISHPLNAPQPISRRAHATWFYQGKVYLFGGGNGAKALNDLWTLDVNLPHDKMCWEPVEVRSAKPKPRGYHTANLIGDS